MKTLKVGDVVELKQGMAVLAEIPGKFIWANAGFSDKPTNGRVLIGSAMTDKETSEATKEHLFELIAGAMKKAGLVGRKSAIRKLLDSEIGVRTVETLCFEEGEYVVVKTEAEECGLYCSNSMSYTVTLKRLEDGVYVDSNPDVWFFQGRWKSPNYDNIPVIRTLIRTFV